MSNKFTSRERMAMIVVAGVVAITIAALALRQKEPAQPVPLQTTVTAHKTVADKPDSTKVKQRKHRKHSAKAHTKKNKQTSSLKPKARDYFTAPENE